MKSEAKPRWLIRVSGEPGVLDSVREYLPALEVHVVDRSGEPYLTSPQFDALSDGRAVLDVANEMMAVVDGMLSMTTGGTGNLKVGTVFRVEDEGKPATQYVFLTRHSRNQTG